VFNYLNTIAKERRTKLFNTHDFWGSGKSREVTTTSTTMVGIEHFLNFIMGETMMNDNVDTVTINIITDEEVARGLMSNKL